MITTPTPHCCDERGELYFLQGGPQGALPFVPARVEWRSSFCDCGPAAAVSLDTPGQVTVMGDGERACIGGERGVLLLRPDAAESAKAAVAADKEGAGRLVAMDCSVDGERVVISAPFAIRRVYFVANAQPGIVRGNHAHWREQCVITVLRGSVKVSANNGDNESVRTLSGPEAGLYLPAKVWLRLEATAPDTLYMVVSSTDYDEKDYIRDPQAFIDVAQLYPSDII